MSDPRPSVTAAAATGAPATSAPHTIHLGVLSNALLAQHTYATPPVPGSDAWFELTEAEACAMAPKMTGLPLQYDHTDTRLGTVIFGKVAERKGTAPRRLETAFLLDHPIGRGIERLLRRGALCGLSLTHDPVSMVPLDVSLCVQGAREDTGVIVRRTKDFDDKEVERTRRILRLPPLPSARLVMASLSGQAAAAAAAAAPATPAAAAAGTPAHPLPPRDASGRFMVNGQAEATNAAAPMGDGTAAAPTAPGAATGQPGEVEDVVAALSTVFHSQHIPPATLARLGSYLTQLERDVRANQEAAAMATQLHQKEVERVKELEARAQRLEEDQASTFRLMDAALTDLLTYADIPNGAETARSMSDALGKRNMSSFVTATTPVLVAASRRMRELVTQQQQQQQHQTPAYKRGAPEPMSDVVRMAAEGIRARMQLPPVSGGGVGFAASAADAMSVPVRASAAYRAEAVPPPPPPPAVDAHAARLAEYDAQLEGLVDNAMKRVRRV